MANEAEKEGAGRAAAKLVHDGDVVGLGTGSTAYFAVIALGERVKAGLKIIGIPTSVATGDLARAVGIPLTTLDEHPEIDITIDGADEIDPKLNLIKGGGGALLREKVVASVTKKMVVVADSGKVVPVLGQISSAGRGDFVCANCGREEDRDAWRSSEIADEDRRQYLLDGQWQSDSRLQFWKDCGPGGAGAALSEYPGRGRARAIYWNGENGAGGTRDFG